MTDTASSRHPVLQLGYVTGFRCDIDDCMEPCCRNYAFIKIEKHLVEHYQAHAPEFLQHVKLDNPDLPVMRIENNTCTAHDGRLCTIQVQLGSQYMPEVCDLYPRRFIRLDDQTFGAANLPCSLMLRSALGRDDAFDWSMVELERVSTSVPNTRTEKFPGYSAEEVFAVHQAVAGIADEEGTSQDLMVRLLVLSELLDSVKKTDWPFTVKGLVRMSRARKARRYEEVSKRPREEDFVFSLCHGVLAVIQSTAPPGVSGFMRTLCEFLEAVDTESVREQWRAHPDQDRVDRLLARYIQAKMFENIFPVANWGDCTDDVAFIATCYSLLRLGVRAHFHAHGEAPGLEDVVGMALRIEWWYYGRRQQIYDRFKEMEWANSTEKFLELVINY